MGNRIGRCKLCLQENIEIKLSHTIPNSFFRGMKEQGQLYHVNLTEKDVSRSQDTGADYMLCADCEHFLNNEFENKSIFSLRKGFESYNGGRYLQLKRFNPLKMTYFILSLIWRSIVSNNRMYNNFNSNVDSNVLRKMIIEEPPNNDIFQLMSLRIYYLFDPKQTFTEKSIRDLVINPYALDIDGHITFIFIFGGYKFEGIFPKLPHDQSILKGVVKKNRDTLKIPPVNIYRDKYIYKTFMSAKHIMPKE